MNIHDLSAVENQSIRDFVQSCAPHLGGRVLDFGCGKQPYREIVLDAGGDYHPYDRKEFGGNVSGRDVGEWEIGFDAILCTQVLAYVEYPHQILFGLHDSLRDRGGRLVLTYPSAWPVIRDERWHFTQYGMDKLLAGAGFTVERHELRHSLGFDGFSVPMGYAALARA